MRKCLVEEEARPLLPHSQHKERVRITRPRKRQWRIVPSNINQTGMWLSLGLAFVGGYGDAASFVLARTVTGHVTGNLVLAAIAVAAHDWRGTLAPLSAIVTFLIGIVLSVLIVRPLKTWSSWPLLPTVMGIEVILLVAASLALSSGLSLALGLQNGAFRRVGGISVHTTYLTGMITSLISTEAEQYTSEEVPHDVRPHDPKIELLCVIWIAFVVGAGTGAALVLHFGALGMLGAALLLIPLALCEVQS